MYVTTSLQIKCDKRIRTIFSVKARIKQSVEEESCT